MIPVDRYEAKARAVIHLEPRDTFNSLLDLYPRKHGVEEGRWIPILSRLTSPSTLLDLRFSIRAHDKCFVKDIGGQRE